MTVVVDASAIVAMVLAEPEADLFQEVIRSATEAYITPINLTEAGLALVLRHGRFSQTHLLEWLDAYGVVEQSISGELALEAYLRFGRGVHRAGLNLGDCFAYALARQLGAPLLYKGEDFARTDIRPALQPT